MQLLTTRYLAEAALIFPLRLNEAIVIYIILRKINFI